MYPPMYTPQPGIVTAESWYERHVIDIGELGITLNNYLTMLFKDYVDGHDIVRFVYNESFAQMVLSMDFNYDEFCLRLIALPDFKMFIHLNEFNNPMIREDFTRLFKQIALELFQIVYRETNPMSHRAQYFADATTLSYMIVVKSYEPGIAMSLPDI